MCKGHPLYVSFVSEFVGCILELELYINWKNCAVLKCHTQLGNARVNTRTAELLLVESY